MYSCVFKQFQTISNDLKRYQRISNDFKSFKQIKHTFDWIWRLKQNHIDDTDIYCQSRFFCL